MSTKFLSPGWRMPRNANQSKSTNYSLDFIPTDIINVSGFSTALSNVNNGTRSSDNNLPFSWSVWFKSRNSSNSQGEIAGYGQSQRNGIRIHNNVFRSNYTSDLPGTTTISQNIWYHGVVTYDGTTRKIYINGVLDASDTPSSAAISNQPLTIGVYPGGTSSFNGELNELCFFDYALSESQVTTLYGTGSAIGNPMALPSTPIAYYPLGTSAWNGQYLAENNAIGDYVFDFSGNKTVGLSQNLNLGSQSTISYWVKSTNNIGNYILNNGGNLINTGPYAGNEYYTFKPNNSVNGAGMANSNINTYVLSTNWVHWTVVRNGTGCELYANGQSIATATIANWSGYDTIVSGLGKNASGIVGDASNFLFWNTNLSATEVQTLYNNGSPIRTLANIPQSSNLKAWYKLDSSDVYDSSTTEWEIDNNANPSVYTQSTRLNGNAGSRIYLNPNTGGSIGGIILPNSFSFSFWINTTSTLNGPYAGGSVVEGSGGSTLSGGSMWNIFRYSHFSSGKWTLMLHGTQGPTTGNVQVTSIINDGTWHHVLLTYDSSSTTLTVYTDNVQTYTLSTNDFGTGINVARIGTSFDGNAASVFTGNLSNLSFWTGTLTSSQRNEIYNNGTPKDLSTNSNYSNLLNWYKLNNDLQDSKGSNDGTGGSTTTKTFSFINTLAGNSSGMSQSNLVQSDLQTVAPYSKYAMNFDAVDLDRIDTGVKLFNDMTSFTASIWAKGWSTSALSVLMSQYDGGSNPGPFILTARHSTNTDGFTAWIDIGGTFYTSHNDIGFSDNTKWINLVATWDGSNIILYINGIAGQTTSASGTIRNTTLYNFFIGGYPVGINSNSYDGELSNCAVWNTALSATQVREIYNEGLPSDLNSHSAVSSLASWWQLGENSSFVSNWIFADEKGTNNGESVNMGVDALTNGVGTTANGTSTSMSEGSLVGNAPYSDANAVSSGMSVVSRVTGSGNTP